MASSSSSSSSPDGPVTKRPKRHHFKMPYHDPALLCHATDDTDSEEEYYCLPGEKKMDEAKWTNYLASIDNSEGFDIVDYPGPCPSVTIVPINLEKSSMAHKATPLAIAALQVYNQQNPETEYEFVKVEKANVSSCSGLMFYITFHAQVRTSIYPPAAADVKAFQALVWLKASLIDYEVKFCRLKKITANPRD